MDERTEWTATEKTSRALLCMLGLAAGSILGWIIFGRITDKCSIKITVLINMLVTTTAYTALILYGAIYKFTYF